MFRFNESMIRITIKNIGNLNTSYVSVQQPIDRCRDCGYVNLNTSYVSVQRSTSQKHCVFIADLNTSYVSVQPTVIYRTFIWSITENPLIIIFFSNSYQTV